MRPRISRTRQRNTSKRPVIQGGTTLAERWTLWCVIEGKRAYAVRSGEPHEVIGGRWYGRRGG
jgi:hypothetical protein